MPTLLRRILIIVIFFCSLGFSGTLCADTLEKRLPVGPGGSLELITQGSDVIVEGTDRGEVLVKIESKGDIEENFEITFDQQGNTLKIKTIPKKKSSDLSKSDRRHGLNFEISVPRSFNTDISTSGGDIGVRSINGRVSNKTSGGDVLCESISGAVSARTSGGDVELSAVTGPVEVKTSGGDIDAVSITGDCSLKTSGGDIEASNISGECSFQTSGGDINLESQNGSVQAGTSGGDIEFIGIKGTVRVKSSSGDITVNRLAGLVSAQSSGGDISVEMVQSPAEYCELNSTSGDIELFIPENSNFQLSASTSGDEIKCDLPVTVTDVKKKGRLAGTVGSGGPLLDIKSTGGDISIIGVD